MPKFAKGSDEAKAYMNSIREKKKKKETTVETPKDDPETDKKRSRSRQERNCSQKEIIKISQENCEDTRRQVL